jgi:hypothetical protein
MLSAAAFPHPNENAVQHNSSTNEPQGESQMPANEMQPQNNEEQSIARDTQPARKAAAVQRSNIEPRQLLSPVPAFPLSPPPFRLSPWRAL